MDERALYEEAACGLLRTDAKGTIARANRTFCRWLGYEEEELRQRKRFAELLSMGSKIFHQTHWLPLLQMQGSVAEVQLEFAHRDGYLVPGLVNAVRNGDHDDVAVFAAADRRKYEDELLAARRRAEKLLESERTAQKLLVEAQAQRAILGETLVGIVSHDLRSPLSVISMGSAILATSVTTPAQKGVLRRIESANARALRLVSDLLDFTETRLGAGLSVHITEIGFDEVVANAVEDLKLAWPGRMLAMTDHGAGKIWADSDRVGQVVTNLVANALTYGDPQRAVTVATSIDDRAGELTVHNWGPPIPKEAIQQIFEPLRRGEQSVKLGSRSVGLGLYIVSEIAAAHRGRVAVTSSLEEGTRFLVTFPSPTPSTSTDQ